MDLGLVEYALWVTLGLWATLFVANPIAKAAGLALIILAVLRGVTEKEKTAPGPAKSPAPERDREPAAPEDTREVRPDRPEPRRRVL